ARRARVNVVRRRDARSGRHVLDDDRRRARNMLAEVSRQQPPAHVMIVADGMADDQTDLLVLVEISNLLAPGARRASSKDNKRERDGRRRRCAVHAIPIEGDARPPPHVGGRSESASPYGKWP